MTAHLGRRLASVPRATRAFSSSPPSTSHIGSLPISIPASVTLTFASPANLHLHSAGPSSSSLSPSTARQPSLPPPHPSPSSSEPLKVFVAGPRGTLSVDLQPFVNLARSETSASAPSQLVSDAPDPTSSTSTLTVTVQDPNVKQQRAVWGLTRSLIANAVQGVSEGYSLTLRLVGVGYRAVVEDSLLPSVSEAQRLNLKLGYAHPVLVELPSDVTAHVPSSTTIVLRGADKQRLGEVGARIRRWRVPEPYNGKGIFVGDEVVRRKEVKKK